MDDTAAVTAFTTGVMRPDGRILAPIMPYEDFKFLTKSDALAIAAYLKSLKPIKNAVPGPFGPNETPTTFDDGRAGRGLCEHAQAAQPACRWPRRRSTNDED